MGLEARNLDGSQIGAMSPDIDQQLDFESIGVDTNPIQSVSPHALESVRPVGIVRAVEHPNQEADPVVSESTKSRDVD
jgi:hypothetical protein